MITLWLLMGMEMFRHGNIEYHIPLNSYEVTTCNGFEIIIHVTFNQNTQKKSMSSMYKLIQKWGAIQ